METGIPGCAASGSWQTWRAATAEALYGPRGFFRTHAPARHFRTSVHVSSAFAAALVRLAHAAGLRTVVDVGAGRGELARTLHELAPDLTLVAVEIAERPDDLPAEVTWTDEVPPGIDALVVANEWLDNVPLDVVEVDPDHVARQIEVNVETGEERFGSPVSPTQAGWLRGWWPLAGAPPGTRAEIGAPRDSAWADVVRRLRSGLALAIDYGHLRESRSAVGTLTAYRAGRMVAPVPDGSCDITAHVAVDAVAYAGEHSGGAGRGTALTSQRAALGVLGVHGGRPPLTMAHTDPRAYLAALSQASEAGELVDPAGLGGFWWLLQAKGDAELPPGFVNSRPDP
ncbi:SAM-dependent methyltransferase [Actinopolymorpha sp. B17G11]|uniref:SAM-dependent methyltransferase n=1 Tax=unclassified Actinopolymorpha TaxID=2627063 RepID=UPI0032D8BCD5